MSGIDDNGKKFLLFTDPMLEEFEAIVAPFSVTEKKQDFSCLKNLYSREDIFGVDLYDAGLGERVEIMTQELFSGCGAVRKTLHKYVSV